MCTVVVCGCKLTRANLLRFQDIKLLTLKVLRNFFISILSADNVAPPMAVTYRNDGTQRLRPISLREQRSPRCVQSFTHRTLVHALNPQSLAYYIHIGLLFLSCISGWWYLNQILHTHRKPGENYQKWKLLPMLPSFLALSSGPGGAYFCHWVGFPARIQQCLNLENFEFRLGINRT